MRSLGVYHDFPGWRCCQLLPRHLAGLHAVDILLFSRSCRAVEPQLEEMEIAASAVLPTEPLLAVAVVHLAAMRGFPVDQRRPPSADLLGKRVLVDSPHGHCERIPRGFAEVLHRPAVVCRWIFFFLGHLFLHARAPAPVHSAYAFLCIVIIYTLIRHAGFGLGRRTLGDEAVLQGPTSYGAALATVIPPVLALLTWRRFSALVRVVPLVLAILVTGMVRTRGLRGSRSPQLVRYSA